MRVWKVRKDRESKRRWREGDEDVGENVDVNADENVNVNADESVDEGVDESVDGDEPTENCAVSLRVMPRGTH